MQIKKFTVQSKTVWARAAQVAHSSKSRPIALNELTKFFNETGYNVCNDIQSIFGKFGYFFDKFFDQFCDNSDLVFSNDEMKILNNFLSKFLSHRFISVFISGLKKLCVEGEGGPPPLLSHTFFKPIINTLINRWVDEEK